MFRCVKGLPPHCTRRSRPTPRPEFSCAPYNRFNAMIVELLFKGDGMSSMVQGVISGVEPIAPGARRDQRFQTGSGEARPARAVLWFIVVLLGFVQAWSHRQLIDHDAVD